MCSVFKGSYVTLAASASADGLVGILPSRDQIVDSLELISVILPRVISRYV
jgi:hypothetical protein